MAALGVGRVGVLGAVASTVCRPGAAQGVGAAVPARWPAGALLSLSVAGAAPVLGPALWAPAVPATVRRAMP